MSHTRSARWHPFRMRFFWGAYSGGVAALNHRLIAAMPKASDSSPSMIWDTRGFHNTRHSGAVVIRVFHSPTIRFSFIHRKQRGAELGNRDDAVNFYQPQPSPSPINSDWKASPKVSCEPFNERYSPPLKSRVGLAPKGFLGH